MSEKITEKSFFYDNSIFYLSYSLDLSIISLSETKKNYRLNCFSSFIYKFPIQYLIRIFMLSKAVVGGGCFWCIEAVLQRLKGVQKVESGYAGGLSKNPTYYEVCSGNTGHAEVVRVHYNP